MKFLFLSTCLFLLSLNIECQPLADSRSGYINFFMEMLNPSFRQHRARLRPFTNQIGSPVINIRGARDLSKQFDQAECIYNDKTIFCTGMSENKTKLSVECEAKNKLKSTVFENVNKFSIGDIRVLKPEQNSSLPIVKLNLYAKNKKFSSKTIWRDYIQSNTIENKKSTFTINLNSDDLEDNGLTVLDQTCWMNLIKFFISLPVYEEIQIDEVNFRKMVVKIANLNLII